MIFWLVTPVEAKEKKFEPSFNLPQKNSIRVRKYPEAREAASGGFDGLDAGVKAFGDAIGDVVFQIRE